MEKTLSKFLRDKVRVTGSGRTDAGVHAIEQSAHFDCKLKIQHIDKFLKSETLTAINLKKVIN